MTRKGLGNFASDSFKTFVDLPHSAIIHESHNLYTPIAFLIIKISMNGIRNFKIRFPNGLVSLQSFGKKEYGKTGHSKIFYFFEAFHDHFEAQFV